MAKSKIEWTEATWNPITGCTKISEGCKNCYAEKMAYRLQAMKSPMYVDGFKPRCHPEVLATPHRWKKGRMIFVNSMSDIFHSEVPLPFIKNIFATMVMADQHQYQVLTKRSERLAELDKQLPWRDHIWMGVSVENADNVFRIDHLRNTGAAVKFLSIEPLIGPIPNIDLSGIDWVIVGGESGPGARPVKEEWVLDIKNQCLKNDIPFFFKQWGGVNKKKNGRLLKGKIWEEMPRFNSGNRVAIAT